MVTNHEYATPVTFCEIFPPDDFPLWFYRKPTAPDLQVRPSDIDFDAVRATRLMWLSVTGLSEEPSRESHFAVLEARARKPFTVLDLDYRPMFWDTPAAADRAGPARRCRRSPWRSATARSARSRSGRPSRSGPPTRCWTPGSSSPSSSRARRACWPRPVPSGSSRRRFPIRPLNGLGAGDSFGGSLCHGLLAGWPLEKVLQHANAAGAIVASRLECSTAMPTEAEIETLIAGGDPNERLADSLAVALRQVGPRSSRRPIDRDRGQRRPRQFRRARSAEINEIRARDPQRIKRLLANRERRPSCSAPTAS